MTTQRPAEELRRNAALLEPFEQGHQRDGDDERRSHRHEELGAGAEREGQADEDADARYQGQRREKPVALDRDGLGEHSSLVGRFFDHLVLLAGPSVHCTQHIEPPRTRLGKCWRADEAEPPALTAISVRVRADRWLSRRLTAAAKEYDRDKRVADRCDRHAGDEGHAPEGGLSLPANGEMARLIKEHDWSRSPLGAPDQWSQSLKTTVGLMLPAAAEIVLFWGPDFVALYNDAFAPTVGNKHPRALGRPARENWAELWDDLQPLLQRVRDTRETVFAKDRPFYIERHGYPETVYFNISYSAVPDETGAGGRAVHSR